MLPQTKQSHSPPCGATAVAGCAAGGASSETFRALAGVPFLPTSLSLTARTTSAGFLLTIGPFSPASPARAFEPL